MKGIFFKLFLTMLLFVAAYTVTNAQRINPKTQIEKATAAGNILQADANREYRHVAGVVGTSGPGAPSGAPPAGSSGIYTNTTTNVKSSWNGSAWVPIPTGSDLTYTAEAAQGTVNSNNGTDAVLPARTGTNAGLMLPGDVADIADLTTLTGVGSNVTNLGTFTGTLLPDNQTIKSTLQTIENTIQAGSTTANGISGIGTVAAPIKLGGTLSENTQILGNLQYSYRVEDAGQVFLESSTSAGTNTSEFILTPSNIIGAYMQTKDVTNPLKRMRLGLDLDSPVGLEYYTGNSTEVIGFRLFPASTLAASRLRIETPNHAAGTTTTGQVLTLQADGSAEYATPSGGGVSEYSAGNGARVFASGAGVTFVRTSLTDWQFNIPAGIHLYSYEIYSTTGQNPGATAYLRFNYDASVGYNQATNGSDAKPPIMKGVNLFNNSTAISRANEQSYDITTGASNLIFALSEAGSGDLEVKISNYTTILGSGASLLKGMF